MKETHVHPNIQKGRDRIFYYQSGFHFVLVKMEWVWVQDIWAVEIGAGPGHTLAFNPQTQLQAWVSEDSSPPSPLGAAEHGHTVRMTECLATQTQRPPDEGPHEMMKWWQGGCVCVYVCAMKLSRWTIDRQRIIKKINQHDIVFQRYRFESLLVFNLCASRELSSCHCAISQKP